jgi:hypothetical protein
MAYDDAGLKMIAAGGAIGTGDGSVKAIYHYATNDTDTAVEADGYFDGAAGDPLNTGDLIFASLDVDGTPEGKQYIVGVGGTDVTVTPMTISTA